MTKNKTNFIGLIMVAGLLALTQGAAAVDSDVEYLRSEEVKAMDLPFSEVVRSGNTFYLSGMLGRAPDSSKLVEGGIGPQTRQAMTNIKNVLEGHGAKLSDIVKCTVFLANMSDWSKMSDVYRKFFPVNLPARSALAVNGLARGALVEIECIAVKQ